MYLVLAIAVALSGCKKADDCQRAFDKLKPVMEEMLKGAGKTLSADDEAKGLKQCRDDAKSGKADPSMDCILKAADTAAVKACLVNQMKDYKHRSEAIEAKLQLNRLSKLAKVAFMDKSAFPTGKTALTPATPCCQQPDKKCAVNAADWSDPTWKTLEFQMDEPFRYQYSYESDGKAATITAVGDPDCSGKTETYTASVTVGSDGNPAVTISEPAK